MIKIQKFEWIEWEGCTEIYGSELAPTMIILKQGPQMIIRMKTLDGTFLLKPSGEQSVKILSNIAIYDKSIEFTS